ncbi:25 member 48 [Seminavis robusta]|uniref:25 member 48 n=1 Tax=Seminavis robusta TaxID=568900 RepID=A0A9N8H7L4_9STRA|nr:25 member 48 [Seminavis robusta]|eukprot:Sro70_g039170.1 25 member 48 (333) ;mRNA; r:124912-125987
MSASPQQSGSETTSASRQSSLLQGAVAGTGSFSREALFGLMGGLAYGLTSPIVGHPFDTIKTKMQAEVAYKNATILQTVKSTFQQQGIRGFYRGFIPPLVGSMVYRGAGFSAYSGAYSACSKVEFLTKDIPFTGGLKPCVLVGALASSFARATIESPFDFVKLRYQIGQGVMQDAGASNDNNKPKSQIAARSFFSTPVQSIRHLYHGYTVTLIRTIGLLGPFFVLIDYSVRYYPEVVNSPLVGPFVKGGICATLAWTFAFPFETAKSVIQADTSGRYKQMRGATWKVLRELYSEGGIRRVYRGFGPGASRSFVANGASMVVYAFFQDSVRKA